MEKIFAIKAVDVCFPLKPLPLFALPFRLIKPVFPVKRAHGITRPCSAAFITVL
jgi:hypothetical protein